MIHVARDGSRAYGVCAHDPVERAALVAMTVEATNEVPAVLVAEGNCNILGGHFKLVDHVPAREVPGSEVEASRPPCGGSDGLPVVGTRAWCPVLATQGDEAATRRSLARHAALDRASTARRTAMPAAWADLSAIESQRSRHGFASATRREGVTDGGTRGKSHGRQRFGERD
jgi:hypothetical protein